MTIVYCAIVSFIILKLIDVVIGLRVSRETEIGGLDLTSTAKPCNSRAGRSPLRTLAPAAASAS